MGKLLTGSISDDRYKKYKMKYARQVGVYQRRQRKGILKTSKVFVDMQHKIPVKFCMFDIGSYSLALGWQKLFCIFFVDSQWP